MPQADPATQHRLLDIAATDRAIASATHRRTALPELAVIDRGTAELADLRSRRVLAETEVADLERARVKLDAEIDQVRARIERDQQRLASGGGPAKDLSSLQHELESLARRQSTLEDQALELMEQRENADAVLATATADYDATDAEVRAATVRRDEQFADIDAELTTLRATRAEQVAGIPADVLAVYDRVHRSGKVAAAALQGAQCQACRLTLDAVALAEIRSAPAEQVVRCTECGAILVRS